MSDTPNKEEQKEVQESESAKSEPIKLEPNTDRVANSAADDNSSATPKPAAAKPATPKPTAPKPAASSPPSLKPSPASRPKSKPQADSSSITFDDDDASKPVSTPMLVIDAVAALVAVTFAVLVLRDVMPFL